MPSFIRYNRRGVAYGLVMALLVAFLEQFSFYSLPLALIIATTLCAVILLVLLSLNKRFATSRLRQLEFPNVNSYSPIVELLYHFALPLLTLLSFVGVIRVLSTEGMSLLLFALAFVVFSLFFVNAKAYYEDKYKLEEQTHIIYDLAKLFMFFSSTSFILTMGNSLGFNFFIITGLVFCAGSLLTFLILLRQKNFQLFDILLILLAGLSLGYLVANLFEFLAQRSILTSLYSTIIFYILNATVHHEVNRTLKLGIILEYLLIGAICFLVLLLVP